MSVFEFEFELNFDKYRHKATIGTSYLLQIIYLSLYFPFIIPTAVPFDTFTGYGGIAIWQTSAFS